MIVTMSRENTSYNICDVAYNINTDENITIKLTPAMGVGFFVSTVISNLYKN